MATDAIKTRLVEAQEALAVAAGRRIRELRLSQGLSQQAVAAMLGLSRPAVTQWENGTATCNYAHALELERILDTDVGYLLFGRRRPRPLEEPTFEEVCIRIRAPRGEISITSE